MERPKGYETSEENMQQMLIGRLYDGGMQPEEFCEAWDQHFGSVILDERLIDELEDHLILAEE